MIAERAAPLCRLPPGGTAVEYTAETTGVSLALVASALDLKPNFAFSDAFSDEKRFAMLAYGPQIIGWPAATGRSPRSLDDDCHGRRNQPRAWPLVGRSVEQHERADGYAGLGDEIWQQTAGAVDALVHAVSTTHSLHGMSRALRRQAAAINRSSQSPSPNLSHVGQEYRQQSRQWQERA